MTILINKSGCVFRTRDSNKGASKTGEVGETEGVIRHLVERGHKVVYFGAIRGDLPCTVVESHIPPDLNELSPGAYQRELWAKDVAALEPHGPFTHMLQMAGFSPTWSTIDNPNFASIYSAGIRYSGPALHVLHHFGLQRIMINCDPRTYPKDQEMSLTWPEVRPRLVLDQCDSEVVTKVGGKKYRRITRYAGCESWAYLNKFANTGEVDCAVVAHAHIKDGCRQQGRDQSWRNVLLGTNHMVYGKGWEHYSNYNPDLMPGPIRPNEVQRLLSRVKCSPCVAQENFYTGKPYVLWSCGCVPLLYGDGQDPYTWDPKEIFLPLNHPWRINKPGDLDRLIKDVDKMKGHWDRVLKPRWAVLDEIADKIEEGYEFNEGYVPV